MTFNLLLLSLFTCLVSCKSKQVMPNLKRVNELPPKTDSKDHSTLRKIEMETNVVPPYLIMLFSEEMVMCTGCIVMPDLVISTASCLDVQVNRNDEKFLAVKITSSFTEYLKERLKKPFEEFVNMTNVEERRSLEYYLHPQYLARVQDIDLVLIKLNHPFDIKENELPKMSYGNYHHHHRHTRDYPRVCRNTYYYY